MTHKKKSNILAFNISQVADIKKAVRGKKLFITPTNKFRDGKFIVRPPLRVSLPEVIALFNERYRYLHLDVRDKVVYVEGFTTDGRYI